MSLGTIYEEHEKKRSNHGEMTRGWNDLGPVETIYEEHEESSLSPCQEDQDEHFSPHLSLMRTVQTWSQSTGLKTDAIVHVQNQCFHLHKDPIISRSSYLKRHLMFSSEASLESSSKITAETFASVANFCYEADVVLTPLNVSAMIWAVEFLEITDEEAASDINLRRETDDFFSQAISSGSERAMVVLRSMMRLLPEVEEKAFLLSRCIEALVLTDSSPDNIDGVLAELSTLTADVFERIVGSMQQRFNRDQDLLYRIVDSYLEVHKELQQEQKNQLCSFLDCKKLSPKLLVDLVQNQKMPLRLIVEAMFIEQLRTRHSFHSIPSKRHATLPITLGTILERDAALRQVSHLKAAMEATSVKIKTLEKELIYMKKSLNACEERRREALNCIESESFRFSLEEREESLPVESEKTGKGFSGMLMRGLKTVFKKPTRDSSVQDAGKARHGDGKKKPSHCRHSSFS